MRMETQNQENIFFNIRGCFEISVFKISGVDCITDHFEIGINVIVFGNTLLLNSLCFVFIWYLGLVGHLNF